MEIWDRVSKRCRRFLQHKGGPHLQCSLSSEAFARRRSIVKVEEVLIIPQHKVIPQSFHQPQFLRSSTPADRFDSKDKGGNDGNLNMTTNRNLKRFTTLCPELPTHIPFNECKTEKMPAGEIR